MKNGARFLAVFAFLLVSSGASFTVAASSLQASNAPEKDDQYYSMANLLRRAENPSQTGKVRIGVMTERLRTGVMTERLRSETIAAAETP